MGGLNFYNFDKQCVTQRTLAIDEFQHPHTAERMIDKYSSVHDSFGIKPAQIALIFSDNASNMVKAFDLLDTELNTITVPYADEHNKFENLDTQILSSDHFSVSHLFPLMTMLLPRYLERETTAH